MSNSHVKTLLGKLLICVPFHFQAFSKSNDSDSAAPTPDGDLQKQELLAKIAMLQTQKVRLTGFLDERSDYLTQFAEEANAEIDQIGEEALKELEETSARIMGNLESQMQAFEESAESSKLALIGLLSIGIVDSLISSSDYRKALVLGVLLIGVLSQVMDKPSNLVFASSIAQAISFLHHQLLSDISNITTPEITGCSYNIMLKSVLAVLKQ